AGGGDHPAPPGPLRREFGRRPRHRRPGGEHQRGPGRRSSVRLLAGDLLVDDPPGPRRSLTMTATPVARSLARPGVPPRAGSRAGRGAPARRLPAHLGLSGTRRPASRINLVGPIDPVGLVDPTDPRRSDRPRPAAGPVPADPTNSHRLPGENP